MSATLEAAPGDVVSETLRSTTYKGATAATFEGEADYKLSLEADASIHHITGIERSQETASPH